MSKIAKCLRCHSSWEIPITESKPVKCKFCTESMFLNVYESLSPEEVKIKKETEVKLLIVKGGPNIDMAKDKSAIQKKTEKVVKEKKQSITDVRVENAKQLVDFVKTLTTDTKEYTKIMSRAFSIIKAKK